MPRISLDTAIEEVRSRDPALDRLIDRAGPIRHRPRNAFGHFGALARAIVYQQLAGRVAGIILDRVIAVAGGELTAEALASVSDTKLRAAGLSANKLASLRDLTTKTLSGDVDFGAMSRRGDEEVIENLITIRGI